MACRYFMAWLYRLGIGLQKVLPVQAIWFSRNQTQQDWIMLTLSCDKDHEYMQFHNLEEVLDHVSKYHPAQDNQGCKCFSCLRQELREVLDPVSIIYASEGF